MAKFKKSSLAIITTEGPEEREGYATGVFGFYKESDHYFITHLPTGLCVWVLKGYQETRKLTSKLADSNWGSDLLFGEQVEKGEEFVTIVNDALKWLQLEEDD